MTNTQANDRSNIWHDGDRPPLVLLVDDEPFNIDLLEQELSGLDLKIDRASNGREAIARIEQEAPDMVFLDLMMPVMDGFGVLEWLEANESWRQIPVVIVSASNDLSNIVRGIEMGAIDFLPKPFEPAILHARLEAGLGKKRLRDLELRYLRSIERELEIGREIQADFLPSVLPEPDGWRTRAHFQAAREVAGDFYDVFEVASGQLGLLLGDVTDKGVGSALYMALYRSLLRAVVLADTLSEDRTIAECSAPEDCLLRAVQLVNRYISKYHPAGMFATLFFGILDTRSGQLCYVNAGHEPPYVLSDHSIKTVVKPTGPMVGAIEEAVYRVETLTLESGDQLVMYSDGITDAQDPAGDMFGPERFRALLEESSDVFTSVLAMLEPYMEAAGQIDDVTLLIVSRE